MAITVGKILYDGKKGLKTFSWSIFLLQPAGFTFQNKIKEVLDQANLDGSLEIIFPPVFLPLNSNITIRLNFENAFGKKNFVDAFLKTGYNQGPLISLDPSQKFSIYRYLSYQI
jgi:hypothetical protein